MERLRRWPRRWRYRIRSVSARNTLDKSEWDGTIPEPQCCRVMATAVAEGDSPVSYEPVFRRWSLSNLYHRLAPGWQITHCPWCGKELPTDLGAEWAKRTDELGFTDMGHYSETPDLPEEYKTDKWWKDAGIGSDDPDIRRMDLLTTVNSQTARSLDEPSSQTRSATW